ncbi:hypothetical protein [Spirosoma sp. KNUC1025]
MNDQPSTARVALKWGAILGIASILFRLSCSLQIIPITDGWER